VASFIQAGRDYVVGTPKPGYVKYPYPHPLSTADGPSVAGPGPGYGFLLLMGVVVGCIRAFSRRSVSDFIAG
jgi:hypothetical protein